MFALLDSDWNGHGGPALHSTPPAELTIQKMGSAIYAAAQAERQASGAPEGAAAAEEPQDEGVVDAEIVDEGEGGAA